VELNAQVRSWIELKMNILQLAMQTGQKSSTRSQRTAAVPTHAFQYVVRLRVEADWDHWSCMQEFAMPEAAIKDKIKVSKVLKYPKSQSAADALGFFSTS